MRIGLVVYGSLERITGGNIYDRMLVSHLRGWGDEVSLCSLRPGGYGSHFIDNLTFHLPGGLDVLLQDELAHPSFFFANARKAPYPIVSIVHHLRSSEDRPAWQNAFYRLLERRYLRSVDGYIFNSESTRDSVHALAGKGKPFVMATPGGDRLGAMGIEQIMDRALKPGPLRLLFLANVTERKGLHVLLAALARLQPHAYSLDVVGSLEIEPAYAARMRQKASSLTSRVAFHGTLDEKRLIEILRQAQVMVIPSSYEGFGIAYLEGMAYGLPAIGSAAGAMAETITNNVNGILLAPGDVAALADTLATLVVDRGLLSRLAQAAQNHFFSRPKWRDTAETVRRFLGDFVIPERSENA